MVHTLVIADEVATDLSATTLRDLAPDLVLAAGDLPWEYVEWVGDAAAAPVVFVPGNHDPETRRPRGDVGLRWEAETPGPRGAVDADERTVEMAGLRIAGLGGCVRYRSGPHQYTQRQYSRRARRLLRSARFGGLVDVLLTHAPPSGLGDADDPAHLGIEALHPVLARLEPTWLLHGHIHPYGAALPDRQVGRTTIRNVIPWRVIDIEPRTDARATKSTAGTTTPTP
jgi:Icc-related predicted phosphoesterase